MDCSSLGFSACGFSQARILEWVPFPSPGDLPNSGIKPRPLTLQVNSLKLSLETDFTWENAESAYCFSKINCLCLEVFRCDPFLPPPPPPKNNAISVLAQIIWEVLGCCCWCSVAKPVSDSLQPHGLQHARLPCPSPSPRVCSNSCPLGQWCHPTISSSVTPVSSCPQSFSASGSISMS